MKKAITYINRTNETRTGNGWSDIDQLEYERDRYIAQLEIMIWEVGYHTFVGDEPLLKIYEQIAEKYRDQDYADLYQKLFKDSE